jgi:hypothetical protein
VAVAVVAEVVVVATEIGFGVAGVAVLLLLPSLRVVVDAL